MALASAVAAQAVMFQLLSHHFVMREVAFEQRQLDAVRLQLSSVCQEREVLHP